MSILASVSRCATNIARIMMLGGVVGVHRRQRQLSERAEKSCTPTLWTGLVLSLAEVVIGRIAAEVR